MTTKDEALKLALEALENSYDYVAEEADRVERMYGNYPTRQGKVKGLRQDERKHMEAITAIKRALSSPAQEPVAWMDALKDAFFEGFTSAETYNDILLNSPEEAWAKYKPPVTLPAASVRQEPVGRVVSANCEYATVQWLQQTSEVGGGDPKNARSWPIAGDAVYTTPPAQPAPVQEPVIDHSCKDNYELIMKWADIYAAQTGELYSQASQDPSKNARMADERTMLACVVAQALSQPAAPLQKREHITDGSSCWCNSEIDYVDPETGVAVIVHKEPQ